MVTPTSETTTGWDDLLSGSGGVIRMVNTEPRLVPTHRVGVSIVGSDFLVKESAKTKH
jgi:hypothetical protein